MLFNFYLIIYLGGDLFFKCVIITDVISIEFDICVMYIEH